MTTDYWHVFICDMLFSLCALFSLSTWQQAPHTFQHPGYAQAPPQQQQQPPPGAAGFPTMDSLRSKLANALLQTKVPTTAAPQVRAECLEVGPQGGGVSRFWTCRPSGFVR